MIEIKINGEIPSSTKLFFEQNDFAIIKKNSILGGEALTVIGTIGTAMIAAVAKILIELIKSNTSAEIEINGIKVKGVDKKTIERILQDAREND